MEHDVHHLLDEHADTHWWLSGRKLIFKRALDAYASVPRGKVLDVGCGIGGMFPLLTAYGDVTGIDVSPEAVARAQKRGYERVIVGSAEKLPFADQSFDIVVALDLLEHMKHEADFVAELVRVLKPRGKLFVTTAAFSFLWSKLDEVAHHYRRYTKQGFIRAMHNPGIRPVRVGFYNFLFFPPIAILRFLERLFPRKNVKGDELAELKTPPRIINAIARALFTSERFLLRCSIPFGVSLWGIFEKK